jgi:L-asparagine transporter-like permease
MDANESERDPALEIERGLSRQLTSRQLSMIAIGGAIGTGLFLGSSLAVRLAGPSVILTYGLGALVALLLMSALSEMAVAQPTAGSFGVYADLYVSRWAGFVVRYTYWAAWCIAIGGEATASGIYCRWWFPSSPAWFWVVLFSGVLLYVNLRNVGSFGEFEYWFSMIKVVAIVAFIIFGVAVIAGGAHSSSVAGFRNYTSHGGFFPNGVLSAWMALVFVIYGYIGSEVIAVAAGEAKDPAKAIPKAMRSMVARLIFFYLGSMAVLLAIVPWNQIQPGSDVTASPFVRVFELVKVPGAAHVVNFVVLTAALSSLNCNLYLVARVMFSLARAGYAPAAFGRVSSRGTPVPALLISAAGMLVATAVAAFYPGSAYVILLGVALFGGLFVWGMIFVTHLFFRPKWIAAGHPRLPVSMPGYPYTSILGALLLLGIMLSTWWVPGMKDTLLGGVPWMIFISLVYFLWFRRRSVAPGEAAREPVGL